MSEPQNFKNHARFHPLFHFVGMPILLINFIYSIVRAAQDFSIDRLEFVFLSFGILATLFVARLSALKAQDRVIRLEEQLRFANILPRDLAQKAANLKTVQLIALRFASDEELSDLVKRTLNGEFATTKDIKLAVKNWRGDYLRV
jgi:Family of unknown function (DUF6526)